MALGDKIYPIILAAGPSDKSEAPKALERFGRRTALEIALRNCAGLEVATVVLGSRATEVKKHVPSGVRVAINRHWRRGQHASLLAAMRLLPRRANLMLYPLDYPHLTAAVIRKLVEGFRRRQPGRNITVPVFRGRSGHPVIFAAELRQELTRSNTARKVVYRNSSRVQQVNVSSDSIWREMHTAASDRPSRAESKNGNSLRSCLEELRHGRPLTRAMALRLISCSDSELPDLLAAACAVKEDFKPGIITYSRKVFLPLTNLCRDYCRYCIFRRDPGQPGAHTMTPDEVLEIARAGEHLGCREALFSLGDKPEMAFPEMRGALRQLGYRSTLHYLESMCELVLRETALIPHANPGLMSAHWLKRLRAVSPSLGLMLESTSRRLLRPGAAHDNAPDKPPELRLRTIEAAGRQHIPFTTGLLIGIGETLADRVDSLFSIRELHRRYGHIQEVIIQNFRVKPGIPMSNWPEPGLGEMQRAIAVARLLLRDVNIQAPPNLMAPDYQRLLEAGINDWGGVSPLTPDYINPERRWPRLQELEARTAAAGFVLKQRLPVYPEFLPAVKAAGGLAAEKTLVAADVEGYARPTRAWAGSRPRASKTRATPIEMVGSTA